MEEDTHPPRAEFWWSMAPAVPSNAFTRTGIFGKAPQICRNNVEVPTRSLAKTNVFYSHQDAVLLVAYTLATQNSAMGTTGSLATQYVFTELEDWDTTSQTAESHVIPEGAPFGGYFRNMGDTIRTFLDTR